MAVTEIPWGDGTSDKLYFSAPASEGNQTVEVSSDANAGAERSKTVNFNAPGVSPQPLAIVQLGAGGVDPDAWLKDGDTHLWINILNDYQLEQQIRIRLKGTIDWGDGTAKETANVNAYTTFTHTYSEKGKYRIDLHPTSGTFYIGGGSSSYNVMGARETGSDWRAAALYQVEVGTSIINAISSYAFYYCMGLKRAYIPANITTLSTYTFTSCVSLAEVIFEAPDRITAASIQNAFYYCHSLQKINAFSIKGTATINGTVRNCYCLKEFTIPEGNTSIAANSLANMYGLAKLFCLPTSAPTVANSNAFSNLPATCAIKVPKGSLSSYQGASSWSAYSSQMSEAAAITLTLTSVSSGNLEPMADLNGSYTTTLTPDPGKTLGTVTVKMGGVDITNTAYSNGVVSIANVTGNITITATAA